MKARFDSRMERPRLNPAFKRFQALPDFAVLAVVRGAQALEKLPKELQSAMQQASAQQDTSCNLSA